MSPINVVFPRQFEIGCAIFNAVLSGGCLIWRLHHQYIYPSKFKWMSTMGFASILFGSLVCWSLINASTLWVYGDIHSWCDLNVKVICSLYVLHRSCLYAFVILRIEVVNRKKMIPVRIIRAGKWFVSVICASLLVVAAICPYGAKEGEWVCSFRMDFTVLLIGFLFNLLICLGSSWLFIRPLWEILERSDDLALQKTVKKEFIYLGTSIIFTIITLLTISLVDGGGGILGFDCAVSSFCLSMLMAPVKRNGTWKGGWDTQRWSTSRSSAHPSLMSSKSQIELVAVNKAHRKSKEEKREQQSNMKLEREINTILSSPSSQLVLSNDSTHSNLKLDDFLEESVSRIGNQSQEIESAKEDDVTPRHINQESLSLVKVKFNTTYPQNHRESISVVNLNSLVNCYMIRANTDETILSRSGRSTPVELLDFGESQKRNNTPEYGSGGI